MSVARRAAALAAIVLLGLALRLYGIHNPVLDHPGWRQGDEAAIARNFAQLQDNIFYPQTDYDGPAPNYVELELQIVPFAAAQLYRAFGVHEIFGRLISVAFSLGTIVLLYFLGREIFGRRAGLIAALLDAIAPGAVYYGRTLTPDGAMIFFMTGALLFWSRWCANRRPADFWWATGFSAVAWLAKPPALLALVPMLALFAALRGRRIFTDWSGYALLALSLTPLFLYFHHFRDIAEWHWAEGITTKHVLPALLRAISSPASFVAALQSSLALVRMLSSTILGPALFGLTLLAPILLLERRASARREPRSGELERRASAGGEPAEQAKSIPDLARHWFFFSWFVALALYTFVVVNVERVDYYLLPWLPFGVLVAAGALDIIFTRLGVQWSEQPLWFAAAVVGVFFLTYSNMLEIHPYYSWSRPVYAAATELDRVLDPRCLVVMGHYDPSVLYVINRKGWEEDPLLWDTHDMTSAIAKGACYFVAVEVPRFRANKPLYRFMQRYARVRVSSGWQVYDMRHFAATRRAAR